LRPKNPKTLTSAAEPAPADAVPARALSETIPDPVFEVIEAHRAASAAYDKAVNHPAVGDDSHPDCKQATRISNRTMRTMFREANRLFKFSPTTTSGLVAMLQYISSLNVWEMPGHFSETREVKGLKALCGAMAAGLKRDGDLSSDRMLLELGVQYDGAAQEWESALFACNEVSDDFWKIVGDDFAKQRQIEETTPVGREYVKRAQRQEDAERAMDTLARTIQTLPAASVAGLGVKAKVATINNRYLWDKPLNELDWDQWGSRSLIEANLAAAGLPPAQAHLGRLVGDVTDRLGAPGAPGAGGGKSP
jgi:hypothetical protein